MTFVACDGPAFATTMSYTKFPPGTTEPVPSAFFVTDRSADAVAVVVSWKLAELFAGVGSSLFATAALPPDSTVPSGAA